MRQYLKIHPSDHVVIALQPLQKGTMLTVDERCITLLEEVPSGHKIAICARKTGEPVIKYGQPIGCVTSDILPGAWIHAHNLKTNLHELMSYTYHPNLMETTSVKPKSFQGYRRSDGHVGVRNEIWILPTVGCVNSIAQNIAREAQQFLTNHIDGIYAFPHPYGCSQLSEDHENTQKALAGLVKHPNAAAVLVLGLGCENNHIAAFQEVLGEYDSTRVHFLNCQDCGNETEEALRILEELCGYANQFERESVSASELIVGLKCGGSDGLSGITANPLVGRFSDLLIAQGGSTILTEVPEMFGAETLLMNRCRNETVFQKTVCLINEFKQYFLDYGQEIYENPSPGNKAGGITTLEDKSLGCIQKGGSYPVEDVLSYGQLVKHKGLSLLQGPGNDLVASTALAVSGAQLVIFTTGRGTPFGAPVPTIKISTNTPLAQNKPHWIDFDAGRLLADVNMECLTEQFFDELLSIASGKQTTSEQHQIRDLAIFKSGVTL